MKNIIPPRRIWEKVVSRDIFALKIDMNDKGKEADLSDSGGSNENLLSFLLRRVLWS